MTVRTPRGSLRVPLVRVRKLGEAEPDTEGTGNWARVVRAIDGDYAAPGEYAWNAVWYDRFQRVALGDGSLIAPRAYNFKTVGLPLGTQARPETDPFFVQFDPAYTHWSPTAATSISLQFFGEWTEGFLGPLYLPGILGDGYEDYWCRPYLAQITAGGIVFDAEVAGGFPYQLDFSGRDPGAMTAAVSPENQLTRSNLQAEGISARIWMEAQVEYAEDVIGRVSQFAIHPGGTRSPSVGNSTYSTLRMGGLQIESTFDPALHTWEMTGDGFEGIGMPAGETYRFETVRSDLRCGPEVIGRTIPGGGGFGNPGIDVQCVLSWQNETPEIRLTRFQQLGVFVNHNYKAVEWGPDVTEATFVESNSSAFDLGIETHLRGFGDIPPGPRTIQIRRVEA